jgi:hypothetical protein
MYGKVFASMYEGSMVGSGPVVFAVWGYCIAKADADGSVLLNPALLAPVIGTSRAEIEQAINFLQSPDANSKNPDHEGRRLLSMTGHLYCVVSHAVYRDIKNNEDRREYMREYMRKRRELETVLTVNEVNEKFTKANPASSSSSSSSSSEQGGCKGGKRREQYPADFEAAWVAFKKYGSKGEAFGYWKRLSEADRAAVVAAIPEYNRLIDAGRTRKEFQGWINPKGRKWEQDWAAALAEWTKGGNKGDFTPPEKVRHYAN